MTGSRQLRAAMLGVIGGLLAMAASAPVSAQLADDPAAKRLYTTVQGGPKRFSAIEGWYDANLPDPAAGCSLSGIGWTYPLCWPTFQSDAFAEQSSSGAPLQRALGFPSQAQGSIPCIAEPSVDAYQQCGTSAGARAAANFGENRVFASARGAEDFTRPGTNSGDLNAPLEDVQYYFAPSSLAISEWVTEITPNFSGWLFMVMGVEMHAPDAGLVSGGLPNGAGTLAFSLFEKPDNLVPPPLRVGLGPGDDGYDAGWTFYGRDLAEGGSNPNFWGWQSAGGDVVDITTIGLTPIYYGFNVSAGTTYSLAVNLTAGASNMQVSDFWGTARLNAFEVESGVDPLQALTFDCGDVACPDFLVRRVGGDEDLPTPVPEPSSPLLLAMGLVAMTFGARRRAARSVSREGVEDHAPRR